MTPSAQPHLQPGFYTESLTQDQGHRGQTAAHLLSGRAMWDLSGWGQDWETCSLLEIKFPSDHTAERQHPACSSLGWAESWAYVNVAPGRLSSAQTGSNEENLGKLWSLMADCPFFSQSMCPFDRHSLSACHLLGPLFGTGDT